jgi:formylglycine-generating enzyme required for sulfatase activity
MKFKLIPAGEFTMGSSVSPEELAKTFSDSGSKPEHFDKEHPQHRVRISAAFYMGITEVTQGQYRKIMGVNPSLFSAARWEELEGSDTSNFPVERIQWSDAVEFCKRLSVKEGRIYRLPTEAEWEYACRAGSQTLWCCGNDKAKLKSYAWFSDNARRRTHRVGKKLPNKWGLYDMHGNVWEWCSDRYDETYYQDSPRVDPHGAAAGSHRVTRGGAWWYPASDSRSSNRSGGREITDFNYEYLGFRVTLETRQSLKYTDSSVAIREKHLVKWFENATSDELRFGVIGCISGATHLGNCHPHTAIRIFRAVLKTEGATTKHADAMLSQIQVWFAEMQLRAIFSGMDNERE